MELTTNFDPQYLTDAEGNRIAVVLELQAYHQLLEQIEELEELQAYDMAIADDDDDEIPFETAIFSDFYSSAAVNSDFNSA